MLTPAGPLLFPASGTNPPTNLPPSRARPCTGLDFASLIRRPRARNCGFLLKVKTCRVWRVRAGRTQANEQTGQANNHAEEQRLRALPPWLPVPKNTHGRHRGVTMLNFHFLLVIFTHLRWGNSGLGGRCDERRVSTSLSIPPRKVRRAEQRMREPGVPVSAM